MKDRSALLRNIDADINKEMLQCYKGEQTGYYWYGPNNYLMPSKFKDICENYFNFKTRSDDVWIVTFPRSGTTLTQELVWLLTHNLDYEKAKQINVWERSPFFEFGIAMHPKNKQRFLDENIDNIKNQNIIHMMSTPSYSKLENMESPRVVKTHFPFSMLPNDINITKPKMIYVARNPKDVAVSFYHLVRLWRTSDYQESFQKFLSQFQKGLVVWGPYWEHIREGFEHRDEENVLFLFYEDMIKDMTKTIHTLADFLSIKVSENDVKTLAEHINIKNFKHNPAVNFEHLRDVGILNKFGESFIRQGLSRGDGNEFTDELLENFNDWVDENSKRINIKFPSKK